MIAGIPTRVSGRRLNCVAAWVKLRPLTRSVSQRWAGCQRATGLRQWLDLVSRSVKCLYAFVECKARVHSIWPFPVSIVTHTPTDSRKRWKEPDRSNRSACSCPRRKVRMMTALSWHRKPASTGVIRADHQQSLVSKCFPCGAFVIQKPQPGACFPQPTFGVATENHCLVRASPICQISKATVFFEQRHWHLHCETLRLEILRWHPRQTARGSPSLTCSGRSGQPMASGTRQDASITE